MTIPIRRHRYSIAVFLLTASMGVLRAAPHKPHAFTRPVSQHATTPAPGSAERKGIMDAMRVETLKMLGGSVPGAGTNKIIFVVSHLKVDRDWAFATVNPASADHKWKGETFSELLHKIKGRWIPIDAPDMEATDENISEAKAMSIFRTKHPQAPCDIF